MTKRQERIIEMLRGTERVTVADLARHFDLTEASIRLDLTNLEATGLIRRFHGGAQILPSSSFDTRLSDRRGEKAAIAERALAHVVAGETLYLDSGSTVLHFARELTQMEDLTVVTNSVPVLTYLGREIDKKLILVGGEYSHDDQCCFGQMTEKELADIYVSKVFMGADSVDIENGFVFSHLRNLNYIGRILKNARQTILLADSGKFNRIRGMKIVDLSDISVIITDDGLDPELRDMIVRRNVTLEIAE
jgi:DeoR family transcriptional regulator, fructose operon transcriptional repressor